MTLPLLHLIFPCYIANRTVPPESIDLKGVSRFTLRDGQDPLFRLLTGEILMPGCIGERSIGFDYAATVGAILKHFAWGIRVDGAAMREFYGKDISTGWNELPWRGIENRFYFC